MEALILESSADLVIVGIAVRTSPEGAAQDIPAAWERFMREGIADRVAGRIGDSIYAVYCDYQTDYRGAYTMVVGVEADPAAEVSDGMRRVRIPSGRYAQFVASGDPTHVIWQTWSRINEQWLKRGERRYIADFERYAPGAMTPQKVQAEIVVGLC